MRYVRKKFYWTFSKTNVTNKLSWGQKHRRLLPLTTPDVDFENLWLGSRNSKLKNEFKFGNTSAFHERFQILICGWWQVSNNNLRTYFAKDFEKQNVSCAECWDTGNKFQKLNKKDKCQSRWTNFVWSKNFQVPMRQVDSKLRGISCETPDLKTRNSESGVPLISFAMNFKKWKSFWICEKSFWKNFEGRMTSCEGPDQKIYIGKSFSKKQKDFKFGNLKL